MIYQELLTLAGQLGPIVALGLLGGVVFRKDFQPKWFLAALALYVINSVLLTRAFGTLPHIFQDARWNWEGKTLALIATLFVASLPQFGWKRAGLTLHQGKNPWPAYGLLAVLTGLFIWLATLYDNGPRSLETIAFQWTMPGIEEEAFYRGVLLLAMNEAFRGKICFFGAPIGYGGILMTVLFGFAHAVSYEGGGFAFEQIAFLETAIPAFLLLWLRERTGSILLPIIGHNIANGAGTLI